MLLASMTLGDFLAIISLCLTAFMAGYTLGHHDSNKK